MFANFERMHEENLVIYLACAMWTHKNPFEVELKSS